MQIILKQLDIEQALKGHIKAQGINLTGKDVSMSFTAGRKEAGISVELNIVDADSTTAIPPAPTLAMDTVTQIVPAAPKEYAVNEALPTPTQVDEQHDGGVEALAPAAGKVSLFGN